MALFIQGSYALCTGTVGNYVKFREFDSGKHVTNFNVMYQYAKDQDGNRADKSIFIDAWGKLGQYASGLEKGDTVLVVGTRFLDEYQSRKKGEDVYKIKAETILVQDFGESMEDDGYDSAPSVPRYNQYDDPGLVELPGDRGDLPDFK